MFFRATAYQLVLNSLIVFRLAKPSSILQAMYTAETRQSNNRVIVSILSVSVMFLLCYTPWAVIIILYHLRHDLRQHLSEAVLTFCRLMSIISHSINFFPYVGISTKLRRSLCDLFKGQCRCTEVPPVTYSSVPVPYSHTFRGTGRRELATSTV